MEDIDHALVYCEANGDAGHALLALVSQYTEADVIPSVTDVLTFNFVGTSDSHTFSLVWFLGKAFHAMWIRRTEKKKIAKTELCAEIEAQMKIMDKTNLTNSKVILRDLLEFFTNF